MNNRPIDEASAPEAPALKKVLLGPSHATEAGPRWTAAAIQRLQELAGAGVAAEVIAQSMHRPLGEIIAKAAELGLPVAPDEHGH